MAILTSMAAPQSSQARPNGAAISKAASIKDRINPYFAKLDRAIRGAECTDLRRAEMPMEAAFEKVRAQARAAHERGNKLMFIGNGGSAGITSHLATDFSKNGGLRATAFNDGAVLTCIGNDFGYEHVFAKQIEWHGRAGDLLLAISSSGRSPNILNGTSAARECGCGVVTMSGFGEDNPLRLAGDVNFYVRSSFYGFVEVAHLALLHAILDLDMGWAPESDASER
jgi:D-sedoheptulose 7-phosphate isomerase